MNNERDEWIISLRDAWNEEPIEVDPSPKTAKLNNNDSWMNEWFDESTIIKDVTAKPGLKPRRDL